jgi:hypothetical protein
MHVSHRSCRLRLVVSASMVLRDYSRRVSTGVSATRASKRESERSHGSLFRSTQFSLSSANAVNCAHETRAARSGAATAITAIANCRDTRIGVAREHPRSSACTKDRHIHSRDRPVLGIARLDRRDLREASFDPTSARGIRFYRMRTCR